MNCRDAREGLSALFNGGMGLTQRALLHAHVGQCVECLKEQESVRAVVDSRRHVTPSRAPLHGLGTMIDALRLGTASLAAWLARLGVPLAISLTVLGLAVIEAGRVAVTRLVDLLTRARWLPRLLERLAQAAATVIEATRFAGVRLAGLLARLRVPLRVSLAVSGQAAVGMIEASRVGVTWLVGLFARIRCAPPLLGALSARTAVKAIGAARVVGRSVATTSGRSLSLPGLSARISAARRRTSRNPTSGARALLKISTGIASLAVVVATMVFSWPRERPDDRMLRASSDERLSPDVRPPAQVPADPKVIEPAAPAPVAETRAPRSVSAPQPAPAAGSAPVTRLVVVRPEPPERPAESPALLRSPDPALAQGRAAASAPTPTPEATRSPEPSRLEESARSRDGARSQNAEASDPAIDWLLKGGQGIARRHIESP
jgi:hypothetical protein